MMAGCWPFTLRGTLLGLTVLLGLWVVACAPADLDITPTPEPTALPTSTPTPTPPPASAAENQRVLETIVESFPVQLSGGGSEWRPDPSKADNGREIPRVTVPGGVALELHYTERLGGQFSVTFGVFDDAEDAFEHYEWIRGIRSVLENGKPREDFPTPNIFGQGLYGSIALVQIDQIFIEVSVSLFTTPVNPLRSLAQGAVNHVLGLQEEINASTAESATASDEDYLAAVLSLLPSQLFAGSQWNLDVARNETVQRPLPGMNDGDGVRVYYKEQTGGAFRLTYGVFQSEAAAQANYERIRDIREGLDEENGEADFPQPHVFGSGLYGSVALFRLDRFFLEVLIERAPGTTADPILRIARMALDTLTQAREKVSF
ncbi:MAG: hypothetical protein OXF22_10275 [Anaerolineaceae bacterium]|nr:hypothetical protein [Anaerolineaceae bacterium]